MLHNAASLGAWLGFTQEKRIITWLDEHGVKWWEGQGGQPCTTQAQIDASFGEDNKEVEFE